MKTKQQQQQQQQQTKDQNSRSINEERLKRTIHATPSYNNTFEPTIEQVENFCQVSKPHVESFSYFLQYGLAQGIKDIEPIELDLVNPELLRQNQQQDASSTFDYSNVTTIKMWVENVKIGKPIRKHTRTISNKDHKVKLNNKDIVRILPRECRERKLMYAGPIQGTFCYSIIKRRNGVEVNCKTIRTLKQFGDMPIMIRSSGCHLENMSPKDLAYNREEVRITIQRTMLSNFCCF
jgi:DNA-directed RNA polymerase beta subunit